MLDVRARPSLELRYGENPHQQAALYSRNAGGIAGAEQLHGKELSYNNLVDLDAAWQLIQRIRRPGGRHHQAHQSLRLRASRPRWPRAIARPWKRDPVSAFGGVLGFQPRSGRGDRDGDREDLHRSDRRAGLLAGALGDSHREEESAPAAR